MAIIEKEIELVGSRGRKRVRGLFDSGATYSCIGRELAEALEILTPLAEPMSFETAERGRTLEAREHVSLIFYIDGYRFSDEFMVLPGLS
ncbi:MAG: retroviral-like aspartic protease, partial [Firmicutes bacterium]|nr:retroviral-like aspartic protease [Bacillota bacterium]